jgi:hypothetical protein
MQADLSRRSAAKTDANSFPVFIWGWTIGVIGGLIYFMQCENGLVHSWSFLRHGGKPNAFQANQSLLYYENQTQFYIHRAGHAGWRSSRSGANGVEYFVGKQPSRYFLADFRYKLRFAKHHQSGRAQLGDGQQCRPGNGQ